MRMPPCLVMIRDLSPVTAGQAREIIETDTHNMRVVADGVAEPARMT